MQYDPNKWPACWILELIAQDRLHEFYTSGLWLRARALRCGISTENASAAKHAA